MKTDKPSNYTSQLLDNKDGKWVKYDEVKQTIAKATYDEQHRVWEVLSLLFEDADFRSKEDSDQSDFQQIRADEYRYLIDILFPEGEPKLSDLIQE